VCDVGKCQDRCANGKCVGFQWNGSNHFRGIVEHQVSFEVGKMYTWRENWIVSVQLHMRQYQISMQKFWSENVLSTNIKYPAVTWIGLIAVFNPSRKLDIWLIKNLLYVLTWKWKTKSRF